MVDYNDIMRREVKCEYEMENEYTASDPESLAIAREEAEMAGEDFEGYPLQAMDFGYRTPCTAIELVEAMVRREALGREERALGACCGLREEASWKWLVRRRKGLINKELPNKLRFYQKTIKK